MRAAGLQYLGSSPRRPGGRRRCQRPTTAGDARALEDGGGAERACGDYDELARSDYAHRFVFVWTDARVWQKFDPDCMAISVRTVQGSVSLGHVQR